MLSTVITAAAQSAIDQPFMDKFKDHFLDRWRTEGHVGQKGKVVTALMRAEESNAGLKDLNSKVLKKLLICEQDQFALKAEHTLSMGKLQETLEMQLAHKRKDREVAIEAIRRELIHTRKELIHNANYYKRVVDLFNKVLNLYWFFCL